MDPTTLLFIYRILIVLGGILAIYLGYRLFYLTKEKQGDFSIKTGTQFELRFKDAAPGVFFALFGAGVLTFSLIHGVSITYPHPKSGATQAPAAMGSPEAGAPTANMVGSTNQKAEQSNCFNDTGNGWTVPPPDTHADISGAPAPRSWPFSSGSVPADTAPAVDEGRPASRPSTDRPPPP